MAYSYVNKKGVTYYLHQKMVELKSGRTQQIFFFSKTIKEGAIESVPDGRIVSETKNGLPVLKRA